MKKDINHESDWNNEFRVNTQAEPDDVTRKRVEAEQIQIKAGNSPWVDDCIKFCKGLRKLAEECHLYSITCHTVAGVFGISCFNFKDGSSVGMKRAVLQAGLLTEDQINLHRR